MFVVVVAAVVAVVIIGIDKFLNRRRGCLACPCRQFVVVDAVAVIDDFRYGESGLPLSPGCCVDGVDVVVCFIVVDSSSNVRGDWLALVARMGCLACPCRQVAVLMELML